MDINVECMSMQVKFTLASQYPRIGLHLKTVSMAHAFIEVRIAYWKSDKNMHATV